MKWKSSAFQAGFSLLKFYTAKGLKNMNLDVGTKLYGFEVTRIRENKKLGGTLYEMTHTKTGAQLCYADNGNENKLFSVAFKTTPEDSTGVFHILEHSVLCGSEKYPVKDPFLELMKSSMNTFLNAMTYSDKTVYPVSSRNEQDYLNLVSVYLDAVFAPKLLENPSIFRQEGWRFEEDEDGNLYFNGVVLSEMKGAMSEVNDVIEQETSALLFKDNCYRHNSGGDPSCITDLTYEKFVETYKRFYHPSNARFFLDGSVPLEKTLSMIAEYLDKFEQREVNAVIEEQKPQKAEKTACFESDGMAENRDNICFAKILGRYDELLKITGAKVLCDYLASTNNSPLKNAVISNSLGENLDLFVNDGIYQPYISLIVRNCNSDKLAEIRSSIKNTVANLVLSKKDLAASLNKLEFAYRQISEPQGLEHAISALDSWLYGGDPILFFEVDKIYTELRKLIDTDFYENLLDDIFSDEDAVTITFKPDEEFSQKQAEKENEKLNLLLENLGEDGASKIENEIQKLEEWQTAPSTPEELALLPSLDINCLDKEPKAYITNESAEGSVRVLRHPIETNGITYITMYFPMTEFTFSEYSKLAVITDLFNELPTEKYTVSELQREIKTNIGSLSYDMSVFADDKDIEHCMPCLTVSIGVLNNNIKTVSELLSQMLVKTDFSDKEKIKNIILQIAQENREYAVSSGHALGATAVRCDYTSKGAFKEAVSGISFMAEVSKLANDFESEYENLIAVFNKAIEFIGTENMILSITSKDDFDVKEIISEFPKGRKAQKKVIVKAELPERAVLKIPAAVSYAVKGWHQSLSGKEADGSLRVISNIVSLAFLWNEVRVFGGAYGAGMSGGTNDGIFCYSYRDPSPAQTLKTYGKIADFLTEFAHSGESLSNFIISAIASSNPLMTPASEGAVADSFYLCGITEEMRKKTYSEMLATSKDDLLRWADTMRDMAEKGSVCVVGGEGLLSDCEDFTAIEVK